MNITTTKLKLFDFTMIVVSLVIGMGIFRTATDSAASALNPTIYFAAWIVGGLIALCGALTYAEIGSRLPVTGGYYKIFSYAYHPSIAFAINCIILISNAASLAIVALIGAGYLQTALFPEAASWIKSAIAIIAIITFYGVNLLGLKMSAKTQTVLMIFKIGMILFMIAGLCMPSIYAENNTLINAPNYNSFSKIMLSFGVAMVAVSFTYGGYQQTINFGNEVENPKKNIPRGILIGITIIIILYLLVNLSYFKVMGFDWLHNRPKDQQIGTEMARKMVGNFGATIFSCLLFFCVMAYVNALLLSNPRVMYAMSEDGVLPKVFAKQTPKRQVLKISLTTFAAICIVVLFFSDAVDRLLSFTIFLDCFGMVASAATIFILRKKTKHLDDTGIYKIKLFPFIPLLFITAYTCVAISIFMDKTTLSLIALAVLGSFIGLYFLMQVFKRKQYSSIQNLIINFDKMNIFKNKNSKIIASIFLALLTIILLKFGCKKDTTQKVVTEKIAIRSIIETVDENGKIYPSTEIKITADMGSTISQLYIQDGDTVRQGQAIAEVQTDGSTMVAGKANNPMEGMQKAMQSGQMNPAAMAQAMQQAQQPATAPTIKKTTKFTTLYAAMTGIISDLNVKKGDRIMGNDIAKINAINDWELRTNIGEIDIVKIREGNTVKIKIDALGNKEVTGVVYKIANNNSGGIGSMTGGMVQDVTNYKVYIKINAASLNKLNDSITNTKYYLRAGMNASIKIETNTKANIVTAPLKAVTTRYENDSNSIEVLSKKQKNQTVVFVYNNNTVIKRIVTTGIQDMDYVEIISGLKKDDIIVTEPFEAIDKTLLDGQKVKLVDKKEIFKQ
jgi:basic amino acid/polyamine antiporter, APA family